MLHTVVAGMMEALDIDPVAPPLLASDPAYLASHMYEFRTKSRRALWSMFPTDALWAVANRATPKMSVILFDNPFSWH